MCSEKLGDRIFYEFWELKLSSSCTLCALYTVYNIVHAQFCSLHGITTIHQCLYLLLCLVNTVYSNRNTLYVNTFDFDGIKQFLPPEPNECVHIQFNGNWMSHFAAQKRHHIFRSFDFEFELGDRERRNKRKKSQQLFVYAILFGASLENHIMVWLCLLIVEPKHRNELSTRFLICRNFINGNEQTENDADWSIEIMWKN